MAEEVEIPVADNETDQNDPLGILSPKKTVDNGDPLGILKKKASGEPSANGGVSTPLSPLPSSQSHSVTSGKSLIDNSAFKEFGKDIPADLQQRHDEIQNTVTKQNVSLARQKPLDRLNNAASPYLSFGKDIAFSTDPNKKVEETHNPEGHWGNIVDNVVGKMTKSIIDLAHGTLSVINDAEGAQMPVKVPTFMDDIIHGLNGDKQKMDSFLKYNQLPDSFLGNTVSGLASIAPDIVLSTLAPEAKLAKGASTLAKAGGLLFNKFTNYLIAKKGVTAYGDAKEQGKSSGEAAVEGLKGAATGAKEGIELALLGAGSGLATKSIMTQAEKSGLVGAKGLATRQLVNLSTDLVAYSLVQPTVNAAEEGRFPTMKEIAQGAGIAAAFRIKGGAQELSSHSKLNKAIEETQNQRQGAAIANFVDADHEAIKQVYDSPETAQELNVQALDAAKKAKETTDLSKKHEYVAQAITLTKASNVKMVTDVLMNPDKMSLSTAIENFNSDPDIPDNIKEQFLKKAQEVTDLIKPDTTEFNAVPHETVPGGNVVYKGDEWKVTKDLGDTVEISKDNGSKIVVNKSDVLELNKPSGEQEQISKPTESVEPQTLMQEDVKESEVRDQAEIGQSKPEESTENQRSTEKVPFEKFKAEQLDHIAGVKDSKFDWRISMDLSQGEREKGVQDIKDGKDTAAAKKVNVAIQDMYDKGVIPMNRGRGTQVENKDFTFEELGHMQEHIPGVEKHVADWLRDQAEFEPEHQKIADENIDNLILQIEHENANNQRENQQPSAGNEVKGGEPIGANDSGTRHEETAEPATDTTEGADKTGIKNKVSKETRAHLSLPKIEIPKMGGDVQVLSEGKHLVESGEVDPMEVIERVNSAKDPSMSAKEGKAMQYHMFQLGRAQDMVNKDLSNEDTTPEQKLELIGRQQQISDLLDAATEANMRAGTDWSEFGRVRQILVDSSFNPSRERAVIKEAYGGDVPKEVKEKLDSTIKERDEAIQARNKVEEQLRETEAKLKIAEMKKGGDKKERKDHKANRAALIDELKQAKEEHEQYLKDNGIQKQGIDGFTLTPKMVKIVGKIAAEYVQEGYEKLEDIVNKVYEEVKNIVPGIDKKDIRDSVALYEAEKLDAKAEKLEGKKEGMIFSNDMELPKPKLKIKFERNNEWVKANQRVINAEYKIRKIKNEAFNSQKNMYQKGLMWASKLIRASVLSGTNVLYKLASAATIGGAGKRTLEQPIGQIYSHIFRGIAEKAPIEGFSGAKAEAKFYKEFFNPKKFISNTWQILKSGSSHLTKKMDGRMNDDLAEISMPGKQTTVGGKIAKGTLQGINKILEFPTDLHMVIKEPLKRAAFEASVKNGMVWAEKNGLDINDALVINTIENAAYKRANYEIFQEENWLSKKFNGWKNKMDKGGNAQAPGKLLADFMIPVSTVPTNIVKRILSTSPLGLIRGGAQVTNAYRKGIENLSNDQADAIMRQLKQGTLGTALWLTGWFAASHFGGLYSKYDPNKKRREGELASDQMEVNGEMIPKPVQHALPLEIIQTAATARHIYDNYRDNKGADNAEALTNAGLGAIGALAEHVPIISTAALAIEAGNDPYKGEKFKEDMQRRFEPQILRETGVIGHKNDEKGKLIERNTKDGGLFRNDLKFYNHQGKQQVATLEEFNQFKDKRKEALTQRLEKLYEGTDPMNIVKDKSGNPVKIKSADMTTTQLTDAISNIKTEVTKDVKEEMFGKQRKSIYDKRQDKLLSHKRKMVENE